MASKIKVILLLICATDWVCGKRDSTSTEYFDLSYSFSKDTIFFPGQKDFTLNKDYDQVNKSGVQYSAFSFCMAEHGGTHIDAPFHFYEDGWTVDRIPPHNLIDVAATVIDVSGAVNSAIVPGHFELEVSHVIDHEKRTGKVVPFGGIVLVHTGWSRYWPDKIKYLGWSNETDVPTLNFPGLSEEVAKFLSDERQIVGIGIDTPSIDPGTSKTFPAHQLLAKKEVFNIENVANLHLIPIETCDLRLFILPLKIVGGTGSPARILAYCNKA